MRAARWILVAVVAVALSGCRGDVVTGIDVGGLDDVTLTMTLTLDSDAADAIAGDGEATLTKLIDSRFGSGAVRSRAGDGIRISGTVTYDAVVDNADITGISKIEVAAGAGDTVDVVVELTEPSGLTDAFSAATADQPDADALNAALAGATNVGVHVAFDGGVTDVRFVDAAGVARPLEVQHGPNDVTITSPVSEFRPGTLVVSGHPNAPAPRWWLPTAAVAAIAVVAALSARHMRRTHNPRPPRR